MAVTPRHYLDFINHYANLFHEKRSELEEQQMHLNVGLRKIKETVDQVPCGRGGGRRGGLRGGPRGGSSEPPPSPGTRKRVTTILLHTKKYVLLFANLTKRIGMVLVWLLSLLVWPSAGEADRALTA